MDSNFADDHPGLSAATVIAALVAVVCVVALVGWQAGWWFTVQDAKRQGQVISIQGHNVRKSFGFQQNVRDEITKNVGDVLRVSAQIAAPDVSGTEAQALKAQRYAILSQLCGEAAQVDGDQLEQSQVQFVKTNCEAGAVSPGSPYSR